MTDSFPTIVQRAIADISEHGFDTESRIEFWLGELRKSAQAYLMSEAEMTERLRDALGAIYARLIDKGQYARYHQGVGQFTVNKMRPYLRAELDRRIYASANLISLNRDESIKATLRRFQGWATSVPAGGDRDGSRAETAKSVKKSLQQMPFVERRVIIDQGHKLTGAINEIIATDGGAIAVIWRSHWREANYNFRKDHKERDGHVYLIRDSWAHKDKLVQPGPDGYYDEITAVAQEPFCRCWGVYIYSVRRLPDDMVTPKGRASLEAAQKAMAQ